MARLHGFGVAELTRALAVVALLVPAGSHAWRAEHPSGTANAVAVDGAGDVVAGGAIQDAFAVVKLDGETGAQQWIVQGGGSSHIAALTVDAANDVLAAGSAGTRIVVKLASATGAQLWRWDSATSGAASSVVANGAGDVVVAGWDFGSGLRVAKLAGATGSLLWEYQAAGTAALGVANDVAVDAFGNVLVAGLLSNTSTDLFVAKLDGATGAELWRQEIDEGADNGLTLIVAAGGDAIVAGHLGPFPAVLRFAAATGAELWRGGVSTDSGSFHDVAVDSAGDVTAAGAVNGLRFLVARIDDVYAAGALEGGRSGERIFHPLDRPCRRPHRTQPEGRSA